MSLVLLLLLIISVAQAVQIHDVKNKVESGELWIAAPVSGEEGSAPLQVADAEGCGT